MGFGARALGQGLGAAGQGAKHRNIRACTGGTMDCRGRSNLSCLSWKAGLGRDSPVAVPGAL